MWLYRELASRDGTGQNLCVFWGRSKFSNNAILELELQLAWLSVESAGPRLNIKTVFPGMGIPMLKIRWSGDRFIFNMGIPILNCLFRTADSEVLVLWGLSRDTNFWLFFRHLQLVPEWVIGSTNYFALFYHTHTFTGFFQDALWKSILTSYLFLQK